MRFVGVIPARFDSSRLPGKPLIEIAGKPLVQWVYDRACQAPRLDDVLVATDDQRVVQVVEDFGGKAMITRRDHRSGTDRVAEVAQWVEADVFVNIQGDEPLISPRTIEEICSPFERNSALQVTTARVEITDSAQIDNPHVVKVVVDEHDRALYFSRAAIPYPRRSPGSFYKHLGIYGYPREFLQLLSRLRPSRLEKIEGLEQLRFLENGIPVQVVEVHEDSLGVDTYEDIDRVTPLLENKLRESERG
ncbi:3-deoxy-manno-octulosonate cytidylyltransferase [Acidobacteria bacterium AH-259-A15]|nr:3-deoxy-manno-octulosonate cytidylyltransferase [Acidobacteria bacterium AH-259-A15]